MKLHDALNLLLLGALWGGSFLFMRVASPILGPIWLIECRVLIAGLALLLIFGRQIDWSAIRPKLIPLIILGIINSAIPFTLFAFATVYLPAGFTSILNATVPLFGTVVAAIWIKEKLTVNRAVGLMLGFVGVVILIGWPTFKMTNWMISAIVAGFAAALLYAIAAPYVKRELADIPPLAISMVSLLSASLFLIPALPFTLPTDFNEISPMVIACVITLALASTALAYILYFRLISNIGASRTLTVTYLIPIFAVLWGTIFLNEALTWPMIGACGLILLGTAVANNLFSRK